MILQEIKLDKKKVKVFTSFEESDLEDKKYWLDKSPSERLESLELMRQSAYGYKNPSTRRLQRVLEIIKGK